MRRRGVIAAIGIVAACVTQPMAPALAAAPASLGTVTLDCTQQSPVSSSLPALISGYPDVAWSATSSSSKDAMLSVGPSTTNADFSSEVVPGDQVWGDAGPFSAGQIPTAEAQCGGMDGTITVTFYAAGAPPVSFGGPLSTAPSDSGGLYGDVFPFAVPYADDYAADVQLSQGAINLTLGAPSSGGTTTEKVTASGAVALGPVTAGSQDLTVKTAAGPPAQFTLTIVAQPVQIQSLAFSAPGTRPGASVTAGFTVTGATTIAAHIDSAAGADVRNLPTISVTPPNGNTTVAWNGLSDSGATEPDGTYTLQLTSTDPQGNQASADATILVDGTPPQVAEVSPRRITGYQAFVTGISDPGSGVAGATVTVDGKRSGVISTAGELKAPPPATGWLPGSHAYVIRASDQLGNSDVSKGHFTVVIPPPRRAEKYRKCISNPQELLESESGLACAAAERIVAASSDLNVVRLYGTTWQCTPIGRLQNGPGRIKLGCYTPRAPAGGGKRPAPAIIGSFNHQPGS